MAEKNISVIMISANFYPHVGGAERQALELASALKKRGVGVRVLTRRKKDVPKSDVIQGVLVERLWCAGTGHLNSISFMLSLAFKLLLEASSYDIIHAHLVSSPAITASLIGRILGKPVFVKIGGAKAFGELEMSSRSWLGKIKLLILGIIQPSFIALTSEQEKEARIYLSSVPLHLLPNGVNIRKYNPSAQEKRIARQKLGWPTGLAFLYTGRFSPQKHLPFFVEAWAEAAKKSRTQAFLALIGEGIEEASIRKSAEQTGVEKRLFIHGPREDLSWIYAAADIFILPSLAEGLSNSLLEAMASGLAVLGSRAGGNSEAVEEAKAGLLFDADNAEEIQIQTAKFLAHPELVATFGRAARKRAEDFYSLDKVAERYERIYRLALS
jgi:glycosyltransferase involved in cell wall biosynthesis